MPIPKLMANGELPPGVHIVSLAEVETSFGQTNHRRRQLMKGLKEALALFKIANVSKVFVDGSFTTDKDEPNDIDGCWSCIGVDDFERKRQDIKNEFGIDFFIAEIIEGGCGKPFPEFFQTNRDGELKGIIQINL
jgi:hypothetical protein